MEVSPPPTTTTPPPPPWCLLRGGRFILVVDEDDDLVGDDDVLLMDVLELVRCFRWDRLPLPFLGIIFRFRAAPFLDDPVHVYVGGAKSILH